MATSNRGTDFSLDDSAGPEGSLQKALLEDRPFAFDFFQAVRLLNRIYPNAVSVGFDSLPAQETVRFVGDHTLNFPASSIREITLPPKASPDLVELEEPFEFQSEVVTDRNRRPPPKMSVSFMGLTGRQGVLPFHYTEFLIDRRLGAGETAPAEFLDIFLHRLVSFFYRAWEKYSIAAQYEAELQGRTSSQSLTQCIFDLIGLGTASLLQQLADFNSDTLAYYSGFIAQQPHSASALEAMLSDYFQVPVRVEQFRGRWFQIDPSEYTELDKMDLSDTLGEGALLGEAVWNPQAQIRLHVGPCDWPQFKAFLPSDLPTGLPQNVEKKTYAGALGKLISLTKFFIDGNIDFDIQLELRKQHVPYWRLTDDKIMAGKIDNASLTQEDREPKLLGLTTWLKTDEFEHHSVDVVLSSNSLIYSGSAPPA
jgi:type VI secretion system protein ImpH